MIEGSALWLPGQLQPRIELRGQVEGIDDPETVVYELRAIVAQVVAKDARSHLVAIIKGEVIVG